eukprot:g17556.t1
MDRFGWLDSADSDDSNSSDECLLPDERKSNGRGGRWGGVFPGLASRYVDVDGLWPQDFELDAELGAAAGAVGAGSHLAQLQSVPAVSAASSSATTVGAGASSRLMQRFLQRRGGGGGRSAGAALAAAGPPYAEEETLLQGQASEEILLDKKKRRWTHRSAGAGAATGSATAAAVPAEGKSNAVTTTMSKTLAQNAGLGRQDREADESEFLYPSLRAAKEFAFGARNEGSSLSPQDKKAARAKLRARLEAGPTAASKLLRTDRVFGQGLAIEENQKCWEQACSKYSGSIASAATSSPQNKRPLLLCELCWKNARYRDQNSMQLCCGRNCQVALRLNRDPMGLENDRYGGREANHALFKKYVDGQDL